MSSSIAARANAELLEAKYVEWKEDADSVEPAWKSFFEGFELGIAQPPPDRPDHDAAGGDLAVVGGLDLATRARIVSLVYNYRTLGHTKAWVNPLEDEPPEQDLLSLSELGFKQEHLDEEISTQFYEGGRRMQLKELIDRLEKTYCGKIGFEFMHIHRPIVRNWIRERVEARIDQIPPSKEKKEDALTWLTHAEAFEQFLHKKYVGQKRFSLEGGESLMVALNGILERAGSSNILDIVMGMAHRGRLNTLANFLHKPLKVLLYEFSENYVPNLVAGDGDVKYHLGFDAVRRTRSGAEVKIHLGANPSHLEAVNGVIEGKARALQRALDPNERDSGAFRTPVLPILIHGDAAFAGQGSVAEVLNLSKLDGYRTGGTVHIVVNNQVGFTTTPKDARSSDYCTDIAKMIDAPVFHVNGDSPMDVLFAAEMALDFRNTFKLDVVLDIVCYRRHGHNEGDEPSFTLPKIYREIRAHDTPAKVFGEALVESGDFSEEEVQSVRDQYREQLDQELAELEEAQESGDRDAFSGAVGEPQPPYSHEPIPTGLDDDTLREIGMKISEVPTQIEVNEKLAKRFLGARRNAIEAGEGINWAFAEALAFGSLFKEGYHARLSGQDCRRGTFAQRHAVLYDMETRERYVPVNNLEEGQTAKLWVYNSLLSEFAVLGFEYGYSLILKNTLVMWEAQFGDFANGAQVIIDQFISSAESKWQRNSSLVMLLPHGYEGQGPEHSSARLERFLQLCAENNMIVANCTTPAQYFHILRRQIHRADVKKPLILMTPKSLLNH
ncbi:MAG: 2-oxoglutarate dehydrogenase E1 component, partial [Verrucomicrobiales bacterium]|nr:2-oxoglutarate dehydrogenase E1 component [Verrucomicrobiales bacterium]